MSDLFGAPKDDMANPEDEPADLPAPPAPDGPGLFGEPAPQDAADAAPAMATPAAPAPISAAAASAPAASAPAIAEATPYRVLARKYRPQNFSDLIGQDALVQTLKNAFAQGRVAHAFMLTGVRGVGKTTTARIIARALNCVGPDGNGGPTFEPCGVCAECRAILADRHPDVLELDAASNNGVDDIRELREAVRYRPAQARFKVYILDEVHMLSTAAFNALLKTLEEPPPQVKFLFATTEIRKVPATILSRCQTFHLRRVAQEELRGHFARIATAEHTAIEPEALAMIARAADGSVRDGLSLLDQAIALAGGDAGVTATAVRDMLGLADRGLALDVLEAVLKADMATALGLIEQAHARGADPGVVLADMLELTHTLTRFVAVPALRQDQSLPEELRQRGAALAETLSIPLLGRAWQMLLKGVQEVAEAPDRRAAAEMVLIRLAYLAELPPPGDLVRRLTEGGHQQGGQAPARTGGTPAGSGATTGNLGAPQPGSMHQASAAYGSAPHGHAPALRAVAGGGGGGAMPAVAMVPNPAMAPALAPEAAPEPPPLARPVNFREVVALSNTTQPMLHAQLLHSVHLVQFAQGRIELRVQPTAPRDLAGQLAKLLQETTGNRWTITLSNAEGEPTLAQQGRDAGIARLEIARTHPLVQAVMQAFPGATIETVRDENLDYFGLPPPPPEDMGPEDMGPEDMAEDDGPEFAPPDAEPADYAGMGFDDPSQDH